MGIIFEYRSKPVFFERTGSGIRIYYDGKITLIKQMSDEKEPYEEVEIACIPEIVPMIRDILINHKEDISEMPREIYNDSLDGQYDCFKLGRRKIDALNLHRMSEKYIVQLGDEYGKMFGKALELGNKLVDIVSEIDEVLQKNNIHFDEFKCIYYLCE